ncbi:hypothetical protein SSP24_38540 [Streptomyces spinoverrucosus]|uniref:Uncharacterized protein n=1 Tax=Streptomyces spinoverrucosus TaxID=284043 RepID=A0A4Y3VKQ7_9ACTN|nr:hypothetical protein [Streptomyces spinoverrucosus]GEC06199.1 hypothetical protein SSP24_38540 [Streptomyces spinoverrucosus]GHB75329.1 hypothetical protein GCM10010397_52110 [Streptomyces spinoverrucosus]
MAHEEAVYANKARSWADGTPDAGWGPDRLSRSTVPVAERLAADGPCLLVTGYEPEMGWYSGCDAVTYAQYRRLTPPPGTRVTLVLFEHGRLQPHAAALARLIGNRDTTVRPIPTEGTLGTAAAITLGQDGRDHRRPGPGVDTDRP